MTVRFLTLTALLLFTACGTAPLVPKHARSPYFDDVTEHLDIGGEVFVYVDIAGDVKEAASLADELLGAAADGDAIDPVFMADVLGFTRLNAVGLSSVQTDTGYLNKSFLHMSKREGLLRVTGGAPHRFRLPAFAVKGADLAFETDIHMKEAFAAIDVLLRKSISEDKRRKWMERLETPVLPGLFSPMDLIQHGDTRVTAVFTSDPDRQLTIPLADVSLPYTQGVIALDGMGFVVEQIKEFVADSLLFRVETSDEWDTIRLAQDLPGELGSVAPVIRRDRKTDRLYIATSPEFLNDCLSGRHPLAADPDYIAATEDLPVDEGNSLLYISPRLGPGLRKLTERLPLNKKESTVARMLLDRVFDGGDAGAAAVCANEKRGISCASRGPFSHKMSLLTFATVNPVTLGFLSAMSFPVPELK